jgi:hypothetical protein
VRHALVAAILAVTAMSSVASGLLVASAAAGTRSLQIFVVQSAVTGMRTLAFLLLIIAVWFALLTREAERARRGRGLA